MFNKIEERFFWYELDTTGNVRRLRNGPTPLGPYSGGPFDMGGYKYTAFGKQLPPRRQHACSLDAGRAAPPLAGPLARQPSRDNLQFLLQPYYPEIDLRDVNLTRDSSKVPSGAA